MKDWNYISENICYKDYDGHIHIRKLNLKTGKYSYLTLYDWELKDIKIIQEEPEKDRKYPKVVYQLGSDSKEYIALKKKYDKLIEDLLDDWYELDNELTLEGKVRVQREKIEKWQDAKEMTEENEG